jgi:hypothetical protein
MRRFGHLLIGLVASLAIAIAASAAPERDAPPLRLGVCAAVGEVRLARETLVVFKCPVSGATVFVPKEKAGLPATRSTPPLRKDEREAKR